MIPAALLCAALLAAPAPDAPDVGPRALVVRARGLDEDALLGALRPRSAGAVHLLRDATRVDPEHTFVDVELRPRELRLTIILADGRVFARTAPAPAGPRDAARQVATMLAAIAGAALDPLPGRGQSPALAPVPTDRSAPDPLPSAVPVPERPDPPRVDPPPWPSRGPRDLGPATVAHDLSSAPSGDTPAPPDLPRGRAAPTARPASSDPGPSSSPGAPSSARSSGHVSSDLSPRPSRPGLDLAVDGAPLLGLGVPAAGLVAGAAGLGLQLRGARRWLAALSLRAAHREAGQFGLTRLRLGLAAGAWFGRGRVELQVRAGLGVEPWLVTRVGRRVRAADDTPATVLLGGHLRLAPSVALAGPLRLGLFAELAASAAPTGRAVQIALADARLFTLGGLEASLGLELQFRLARAGPRRPRVAQFDSW